MRAETPYLAGLAVGLAFLWASGMAEATAANLGANDLSEYWTISRTLLEGGDPYDAVSLHATAARYGTQVNLDTVAVQTPWTAFALVPLALMDVRVANVVWLALSALVAVLGVRALLRTYAPALPLVHAGAGVALFGAPSSIHTVYVGQWTLLLTGSLAWCVVLLRRRRERRAAVAALALLAKPHLFLFTAWSLLAAAQARRLRVFIAWAAILGGLVVLAAWVALPHWWDAWRGAVPAAVLEETPRASNVPTLLYELAGPAGLVLAAALLVTAVAVGLAFDRAGDAHLAYWTALSPVAAAYTRGYDLTLLVVPIVVAAGVLARRSMRLANAVPVAAFAVLTLVALALWPIDVTAAQSGSAKAVVGLAILVLLAAALWRDRREPDPPGVAR